MASPFAKYQSEQVQQIAPGFVEAYGRAGASIGQGLAAIGQSVFQGYEEAEKKQKEELANKAALSPYIRNDERVKRAEDFAKAGIFTKAADGTLAVSADWVDKVNMPEVDKVLSFYNTTGGDGSKLKGNALTEFTARYQSEQKYAADQAAKASAQVELDYKRAQIAELNSKAAERNANAGMYGGAISAMLGGGAVAPGFQIPEVTLPDTSTPGFQSLVVAPVSKADTTPPGVAAPATAPAVSAALTAGTTAAAAAAEPAAPAPTSADFDKYGYPKQKPMPAAPAAKAAPAPAQAAQAPAAVAAPAAQPPAQDRAAAPAAPVTYDVPAESARVAEKMKAVETKRATVTTKYQGLRTQNEGRIAAANRNMAGALPRNATGFKIAESALVLNEQRRKSIADAEARELKTIDAEADAIKTDFTTYQAAAEAARKGRAELRDIAKEAIATKQAEQEFAAKIAKGYPMIGVLTYRGYGLKDPASAKIAPMGPEQFTEATEQNKGRASAHNLLLEMSSILEQRERTGDEYSYKERFRATAADMENYFKAELSGVFGVASTRKAIVSGGNFSDADREYVKAAITYLNSGAVDMTSADMRASLNALAFMLDGMYRVNLEELGMNYNKTAALKTASVLRDEGDEAGARGIERQVTRTDKFNTTFNLGQDKAESTYSRKAIDAARKQIGESLKGFKYKPTGSK